MRYITVIVAGALFLSGCEETADRKMNRAQEQLSSQGAAIVGIPSVMKFAEKRLLKDIIELRDQMPSTYTYLVGEYNGTIGEKVCDSLGYGLPYATQYTNPMRHEYANSSPVPQADPNGLFSPSSAEGTWVLCKEPNSDNVKPQYIEGRVIVLTFPKESRTPPPALEVKGKQR